MTRYCPKCKTKIIDDRIEICPECGVLIENTTPLNIIRKKFKPEISIILGFLIIISLYVPAIHSNNFTIAETASSCNGSFCNLWTIAFYGGWAIGIACILWGSGNAIKKYTPNKK